MISILDVRLGSKTSLQLFVSKVQFIKNPKDFQTWIVSSLLPYIYYSFCFSKTHTNDNNITNKETLIWGKDRTKFLYLKKSWICAYRDHNHFDAFRIQNRHAFTTPLRIVVHGNDIFLGDSITNQSKWRWKADIIFTEVYLLLAR